MKVWAQRGLHALWRAETWFSLCCLVILGFAMFGLRSGHAESHNALSLYVAILSVVLLLTLRRAALAVWIVAWCGMAALAAVHEWSAVTAAALQLALTNLFLRRGGRVPYVAAVLTFADLWLVLMVHERTPIFGTATVTFAVWTLGAAGAGVAVRSRQQYIGAIEERARWAVETREAEAQRRVAEERLRIARDLHDVVGHHAAVIRMHTGLARRLIRSDPDRAETALREAESATKTVLREMAGLLRVLRESDQDEAAPAPGLADLDPLVATLRSGGMDLAVDRDGDSSRVPPLIGLTAYRVAQELLTNARRHGRGPVTLSCRIAPEMLTVRVTNRVAEAPDQQPTPGYGLLGIQERVRAAGGRLSVSRDDATFTAAVELPLTVDDEIEGFDMAVVRR
ncbi:sensor histidine kinase [Dactylosporangium sp. CA-233914]|uniref:sensor histidine kinase n=1 Tax=Dactylosporangium sp. CA-233914 TaxID=3239934 RepID=UPI003D914BB8